MHPRKNAAALQAALRAENHFLRYNVRAQAVEWSAGYASNPDKLTPWQPLDDRKEASLRERVAERHSVVTSRGPSPLRFGRDAWRDAVNAIVHPLTFDPFVEWLEGLPGWDGVERIDALLTELFGADDTPPTRWASRFLTLGAVQRTMQPGCKLDEMPVLIGRQAIGKSALLRQLIPPEFPEWFSDTLCLSDTLQKRVESLLGVVIAECSEMAGMNRAEIASLKAFVTRQNDGNVRLSYDRRPETQLRRCVIVGTADRTEVLPSDPAGLRRWVPVTLKHGCDVEDVCAIDRKRWWAEALHKHRSWQQANLPLELRDAAAEVAERHRKRDHIYEDLAEDLDLQPGEALTLGEIAARLGVTGRNGSVASLDMGQQKRLGDALRQAGFRKIRPAEDGVRKTLWTLG